MDDDAIAEELANIAEAAPEWIPESSNTDGSHSFPLDLVMSARQLIVLPLPQREDIISTVLYEQSLSMIYAKRGLGKTRCAMTLVDAVTKAEKWFAWTAPKARRCLFIDGELPAVDLQGMVREMCGEPSPLLEVVSSEFFFASQKRPLTISDRDHQVRLVGLLEQLEKQQRRPDLIVFDNLSAMTFGLDENGNTEQDAILPFLLELRHRGFAPTFIHHTGHNIEQQRGASRREDFLDLSIRLTPLADSSAITC
jgi:AAA domain